MMKPAWCLKVMQPIDLQALFSQLDKVGRTQAFIREGQQLQDALHQADTQRKLEQNIQSVNQAQNMGEEDKTIKDENRSETHARNHGGDKKRNEEKGETEEERPESIRDPALGRNLDISG